jgi:hypothetical protein
MMLLEEAVKVSREITQKELFTGDLLFMTHPDCNISQAIDQATQTGKETHFSHIGIVEREGEVIKVYHSSPKRGVCCETLEQYLHPDDCNIRVAAYRLKEEYLNSIPKAMESARQYLGISYNHSFILTDAGYYCSEFIYKIFAPDEIFNLYPMTFKDPSNGEFIPAWVEYYHHLEISIPEGQLGCNPNGIAASDKLELLGELKKL